MKIELFNSKKHNRIPFDCGDNALNTYLQRFANQDQKRNLTRIYVLAEETRIIGYYSICAHSVSTDELPKNIRLAHYPDAPFLLLGRLAVDNQFKHQRNGGKLLFHAFKTTSELAEQIDILGMVVDAKDENATNFYQRFGFEKLSASSNRLVLPLRVLKPLIS